MYKNILSQIHKKYAKNSVFLFVKSYTLLHNIIQSVYLALHKTLSNYLKILLSIQSAELKVFEDYI